VTAPVDTPDALAFPTSAAQRRLWLVQSLHPESPMFNVPEVFHVVGTLSEPALRSAVGDLVASHEPLRTSFVVDQGAILQVVNTPPPIEEVWSVLDLAGASRDAVLAAIRPMMDEPFALDSSPLLRSALVRVAPEEFYFALVTHHIVCDEASMVVLMDDLSRRYAAHAECRATVDDAGPDLQYADFALWEEEWLTTDECRDQLAHWKQVLEPLPPRLGLGRHGVSADRAGDTLVFDLGDEVAAGLRDLARTERCSPFVVAVALSAALAYRSTGQVDIAFGSPVSTRTEEALANTLGLFLNTVVLRIDLAGRPSFRDLLHRGRAVILDAFEHQQVPFDLVVDAIRPADDRGEMPLVHVLVGLRASHAAVPVFSGATATAIPVWTETAKFDLSVMFSDDLGGGLVEYGTNAFAAEEVERMVGHLLTLAASAVARPDAPVATLDLLTEAERTSLLTTWNSDPDGRPAGTLLDRFWAQVAQRPDAAAVVHGDDVVSYRELAESAVAVSAGVAAVVDGPEAVVGLLLGRGIEFVATMLGVLQASAAFLPMDASQPIDRNADIASGARVSLLIVDGATAGHGRRIAAAVSERGASLEARTMAELVATPSSSAPSRDLAGGPRPANLAYVLSTSGSTGAPKGAMVEHAGMLNHNLAKILDLDLGPEDVVAQVAPPTFDVVVWQCLAPLAVGGRVHVVGTDVAADPVALAEEVVRGGVTVLQLVPAMLAAMVDAEGCLPALQSLRWMVPTGDALPAELVARWFAAVPNVPLLNTYGLTECSDDQCHYRLDRPDDGGPAIAAIGRPIANLTAHVLDGELGLVPVGVTGELFLGGVGVGRGYVGQPRATAARYRPDPFSHAPGARVFATGDLVRRLPTGNLEFIGRADHQVKIRGHRLELGEIEAHLATHPVVAECIVMVRGDAAPGPVLVAYLVCRGELPTVGDIQEWLRSRVPEHMVPTLFVSLTALPLTAHGKVDRARLPLPAASVLLPRTVTRPPATAEERAVAALFSELLGVGEVGADDSFFALGGHSLLAVTLVSRLREEFRVAVPLRTVFADATVGAIAARLATPQPDVLGVIDALLADLESGR
jgi:amino acid adenylation domain-containing protein